MNPWAPKGRGGKQCPVGAVPILGLDHVDKHPIALFSERVYMAEPHYHVEYEVFYLDEGRLFFRADGTERLIVPGDVVFLEPGAIHTARSAEAGVGFHYYAMVFGIGALGQEAEPCRLILEGIRLRRYLRLPQGLLDKLRTAARLERERAFGRQLFVKALLLEIMALVVATGQYLDLAPAADGRSGGPDEAIARALSYIRGHYRDGISLDRLARDSGYSRSHFARLFKAGTGLSLTDYVNKYRVEKSCLDLMYSGGNVTEVATKNGFATVQYFSKLFRRYMKCSPKQYQKSGKNLLVPSSESSILD